MKQLYIQQLGSIVTRTAALTALLLSLPCLGFTQTISVFSKENKQPLDAAYIICKPAYLQSGAAQTLTSDNRGKVTLPCKNKQEGYAITVYYPGYETLADTVFCGDNKVLYLRAVSIALKSVVVTAQYEPSNPERSVYKVKILDNKEIEARAATNLKDLLSQELNIRLSQDNILGTGMSMQGISGENIKILVDGVPVTGRTGGNIDLSQISLNNVERIEMVEGPLSVNYGTNALGGAINIITKKEQYERVEIGGSSYYESVGQYNADLKLGYKTGTHTFQVTGARNYFDGWRKTDNIIQLSQKQAADSSRFQDWKPREQYQGGLHYHKNFKTLQLHLASNYFSELITNKGMPRQPYYEDTFDDYYRTVRFDNTALLDGKVSKTGNVNVQIGYNDYERIKNTYYKNLTTLEENLSPNTGDQDTTNFRLLNARGSFSTSDDSSSLNYEIGYDINVEQGYGQRIKQKEQGIGDYALFASAEYTPVKIITEDKFTLLAIRPGVRYAYSTVYPAPLVPSLNVLFRPKETMALRASYARGFRAPSLKELHFEFVDVNHNIHGNPDLHAELSNNYQASASFRGTSGRTFWRVEPSFFYNDIHNLITLAFNGESNRYSYINIGDYHTYGTQLTTEFGEQELSASLGGSFYQTHTEMGEKAEGRSHDYTPEINSSVRYQLISTQTQFALFYKYTGKVLGYHTDSKNNVQQHWMDDYHTLDLTVNQPLFKKRVIIAAGAKNLLDVRYLGIFNGAHTSHTGSHTSAHSLSMPVSWGRTFFIHLKLNLSKRV